MEERGENKTLKAILGWVRAIVIAVICGLIINYFVLVNAVVISSSMEDTVMTDSRVVGLRVTYYFNEPGRFDIILFQSEAYPLPLVKRIIGLPGEKLEIINGKVYINDYTVPLNDSFILEKAWGDYGPFIIPVDCYFVMGDNRNNSMDSRDWDSPFVPRGKILGRLFVEIFPSLRLLE